MEAEQFIYWLRGFQELNNHQPPTPEQWKLIEEHLSKCFVEIPPNLNYTWPDSSAGDPNILIKPVFTNSDTDRFCNITKLAC